MVQTRLILSILIINFLTTQKAHSIIYNYETLKTNPEQSMETLDEKHLQLASNPAFDAVGKLALAFLNTETNKFIRMICTGTLISPYSILTTADCISPLILEKNYTLHSIEHEIDNTFTLGNDLYNTPFAKARVVGATYFEGFNPKMIGMDAQNIAVLFLDAPIRNVEPAKLYGHTFIKGQKNINFHKKPVVMVGFGFRGDPIRGVHPTLDDRKRACNQMIMGQKRTLYITQFNIENDIDLQGMFTHGDQGGPMFMKENNQWYVVGINCFRNIPEYQKEAPEVKKDPRFTPYGTTGYSLAIPPYLKWIKKNYGIKKIKPTENIDSSEWNFRPYWNGYEIPNNEVGKYFKVAINQPGRILINHFFEVEKIVLNHEHAQIFIPQALPSTMTEDESEEAIKRLIDAKKPSEALEFRRRLFTKTHAEKNTLFHLLQLKSHDVTLKQGMLHVDGELTFDRLKIKGGILKGHGELINATIPAINFGGTIEPYHPKRVTKLTVWGDYIQHDHSETKQGGILKIRVHKYLTKHNGERIKNDVFVVKGHTTLGGTLILNESHRHVKPNDEITVLYSNNVQGRFANIIGPDHVDAVAHYSPNAVKIRFREKPQIHIQLSQGQQLLLTGPARYSSLDIDGGILFADSEIFLSDGNLRLSNGIIKINTPNQAKELILNGNYEQNGGTLSLKLIKTLVETKRTSEVPPGMSPAIDLNFNYQNDRIKINGHAKIGGKVTFEFDEEPIIKSGSKFTILEAQSITGEFDGIEQIARNLRPRFIYTPTTVEVIFEAGLFSSIEMKDSRAQEAAKIFDTLRNSDGGKKFELLYKRLDSMPQCEIEDFFLNYVIKTPGYKKLIVH